MTERDGKEVTELEAGVPWPEIIQAGDAVVHGARRRWVPMEGFADTYVKILWADRKTNTVIMLGRMAPNSSFPMHEHRCRAFAYTLQGNYWYGERTLPEEALAVEDPGSTHFPQAGESGFTVLTVFVGEPGEDVLLRVQDPETLEVHELGIDYFIQLMEAGEKRGD